MDPRIGELITRLKDGLDLEDIVPTVLILSQLVEQYPNMKGPEKLALLQATLVRIIEESDLAGVKKKSLLTFAFQTLPVVMQAAILASKNPIGVKVQAAAVGCFTWLKKKV